MKQFLDDCVMVIVIIILACFVSGCSSQKELTHVEYIHDTTIKDVVRYDSIDRWHTHYEYIAGDTIRLVDTFYCDRWHQLRDTTKIVEVQYRDVEKAVEVEKKVYKLWPGLLLASLIMVIVVVWRLLKKVK